MRNGERAADMDSARRVFDGVVEKIEHGGAEIFGDALDMEPNCAGHGLKDNAVGWKVVSLESDVDTLGDQDSKVDESAVLLAMLLAKLPGFQNLFDGGEEPVRVGEHDGVELLALSLIDRAALEGLEVETDTGNRGLELVCDGVEEGVLALIASNLADKEDGIEHDAGDKKREEDDAEDGKGDGALVDDDPGTLGDGEADEEDA